ncbi:MAG: 50S ribosomal protein L10 [Candidatus Binatia bacterium]
MAESTTATRGLVQQQKAQQVAAVREMLKTAKMALVTEYRGLTVAQMTRLRKELREVAGEYKVIKNTLVRRALQGTSYDSLNKLLEGPTGWVFGYKDPVTVSKVLVKFLDDNQKLAIKGGLLEGQVLDQAQVKNLAKMPSRAELQATLLALMQAPVVHLLRLAQEPGARMVRLLETLRKTKESAV